MPAADFLAAVRDLLGHDLDARARQRLDAFVEMLGSWSKRMNLVSVGSEREIWPRHVLDSLAPSMLLDEAGRSADLGSGAGFPGIPLAILLPEARFDLVESRRKRASFLRHVVRTLGLERVEVFETRGEDWTPEDPPDTVLARGVRVDVVGEVGERILGPSGALIVFRKAGAAEESHPAFELDDRRAYRLPGGERHEVVRLRRRST